VQTCGGWSLYYRTRNDLHTTICIKYFALADKETPTANEVWGYWAGLLWKNNRTLWRQKFSKSLQIRYKMVRELDSLGNRLKDVSPGSCCFQGFYIL